MLTVSIFRARYILLRRRGHSSLYHKAKGKNQVENKLESLVGQGVFVVSNFTLLHVLGFSNGSVTGVLCKKRDNNGH